jgi:hypothetical protein
LAVATQRFPDTAATLAQLLQRWGAGLTEGPAERRMAVRLSQQRLRLLDTPTDAATDQTPAQQVSALPSVRRLAAIGVTPATQLREETLPDLSTVGRVTEQASELMGDDDEDADLDQDDFYADVMDSG